MPDINPEKVLFVVEKARELQSEDEGAEPDASNATDDDSRNMLTDLAFEPIRNEMTQFIEALDVDEKNALVALAWIGRGDFEPEHWEAAVQLANERREGSTTDYLLGIPQLPAYLEEALDDFGAAA